MKRRLYILAPNDRFNYGDLLFPYILTYYFKDEFDDVIYVSTSNSNLSKFGGIPTENFRVLYKLDNTYENHLIVAGGEALCAGWMPILAFLKYSFYYLNGLFVKLSQYSYLKKISISCSRLVVSMYGAKTLFPFSVGKNELPMFKTIVYNALGGTRLLKNKILNSRDVVNILSSVDYLTVRDKDTSCALRKFNINHRLCPDTAMMMSEVFDEDTLQNQLSISLEDIPDNYIFFQGSPNFLKGSYKIVIEQLTLICNKYKCMICLCPIGTALGHSNQVALNYIYQHLKSRCFYIEQPNIFDIMYLIKCSKMYIGSSLHGVITAMSFGVPFVAYGPRKVKAYISSWCSDTRHYTDIDNISDVANLFYNKKENYDFQKELIINEFKNIMQLYTLY